MSLAKQAENDLHKISDGYFGNIRSRFTTEELATLCTFIALISGTEKFGIIVGLSPDEPNG